jgi:hypothetical protein
MALTLDEHDPCAAAKALREVYYRLIAGQAAATVSFTAGPTGVSRSATFHAASPDRLMLVIRGFEENALHRRADRHAAAPLQQEVSVERSTQHHAGA